MNCRPYKNVGLYRVPLRCAVFKVIPGLAGCCISCADPADTAVFVRRLKGACFLQGAAEQQPILNEAVRIGQKLRLLRLPYSSLLSCFYFIYTIEM